MTEAYLWALSQDALGLIDTFSSDLLAGRYREQDLEVVEKKLRA